MDLQIFSHPLFILIAGTILTGLLVPYLTRRWQAQQRGFEIKTRLVSEISELVWEMMGITTYQFHYVHDEGNVEVHFEEKCAWNVKSGVLGACIRAHFPKTNFGELWDTLSYHLLSFYDLSSVYADEDDRQEAIQTFQGDFKTIAGQVDWQVLDQPKPSRKVDLESWKLHEVQLSKLKSEIVACMDELNAQILTARIRTGA